MKSEVIQLTENKSVTLTTYIYDTSQELQNVAVRPALLIFPGGGYNFCSDREGEPIALAYMAKGYNAFVLRYSIGKEPGWPAPLREAEMALDMIRNRSSEWQVNPDKVAVCGFSAGGHLAAAIGTMGLSRPNAMILVYPCILASDESRGWPYTIPALDTEVDKLTPEAFVAHTYMDNDVSVENPLAIVTALCQARIPVEFHLFRNGVHGLSLSNDLVANNSRKMVEPDFAKWFDLSVCWLDHIFGAFHSVEE
jgi:acetyl esterase/lipase